MQEELKNYNFYYCSQMNKENAVFCHSSLGHFSQHVGSEFEILQKEFPGRKIEIKMTDESVSFSFGVDIKVQAPVLCKYVYGEKIPKKNFAVYHNSENFEKFIKIELEKLQKQYPEFKISFERNGFTVVFIANKK